MSYLLHFSGPASFEQTVTLKPGGAPVVVGRDQEAAVFLPDTERLVSRRHLSIEWTEAGARITVLSANGINTDRGDYFNGDEVVLTDGESARVGSFSMIVASAQAAVDLDATSFSGMGSRPVPAGPDTRSAHSTGEPEKDPWADLASFGTPPKPPAAAPAFPGNDLSGGMDLDDPFSSSTSWRLDGEFAGSAPAPLRADDPLAALASTAPAARPGAAGAPTPEKMALQSLCRGLGVEPPQVLTSFDWEGFGHSVRHVVQCLSDQLATRQEFKKETGAEDRTMLGASEVNPLKTAMPLKELIQYLLFMPGGAGGFVPAARALQEAAQEARWHEAATRSAARGLAQGALKDFEPAKLRSQLLRGKLSLSSVVDNARLWDFYSTHYQDRAAKPGNWADELFNRYYMAAYLRETERLRRAAMPRPAERRD